MDGQIVENSELWFNKRRKEIVNLFEQNQFGVTPKEKIEINYDLFESEGSAFDNTAERTQVTLNLFGNQTEKKINLVYYIPKNVIKPVPVLLYISFGANSQVIDDPQIKEGFIWNREKQRISAGRNSRFGKLNVKPVLESGFGFAIVYYGDIEPDFVDGYKYGVRSLFEENGDETLDKSDAWGSIAVWGWGLSRILDYFETDNNIDATSTVIMGVSRLGKTVLWAGALDERIASVIAVCSGESGATLSRRNYGETIAHISSPTRYHYWFAPKYQEYGKDVKSLPVDGHMLISLIAPRPILLITGNTDKWSDPYGEYLAAKAAEPVYELLNKKGLETEKMPSPGNPVLNDIGFYMHDGGHGMVKEDWEVIIEFLKKHFK
ncbi:MAG: hypothetical protein P8X73_11890 [Ignavibacteriaceae bacterium]